MITLLFIFVMTILMIAGSQDIILENKMQNNTWQASLLFERAELGLEQKILSLEGRAMTLSHSSILLQVKAKIIKMDDCDNKTIDIQSTAKNSFSQLVLNSRAIFAKVPREKNCKKVPVYGMIWWTG